MDNYFGLGACAPLREDLPQNAQGAVECVVNDGLVDTVGLYLIDREDLARELYVDRLAQYGIALETGDCAAGTPGDHSWFPINTAAAESLWRTGCFVNEDEHANVRVTCPVVLPEEVTPSPGFYYGVLGSTLDITALYDWAWGDADWRDYVTSWQAQYPDEPGFGPAPAICIGDYFEP